MERDQDNPPAIQVAVSMLAEGCADTLTVNDCILVKADIVEHRHRGELPLEDLVRASCPAPEVDKLCKMNLLLDLVFSDACFQRLSETLGGSLVRQLRLVHRELQG